MDKETFEKLDLIPKKQRDISSFNSLKKEKCKDYISKSKTVLHFLISFLIMLAFLFPFYILLVNSFKSNPQISENKLDIPVDLYPENYSNAISEIDFFQSLGNTLLITILANLLIILISSSGAWMMVRTNSKLGKVFYTVFIFSLIIPFQILMIPLVWWAELIGLEGIIGLVLLYVGFGIPMSVFLIHSFVKSIPDSVEEAALIDGAGMLKIFFKLILPLLKPIILTVLILNTIWIWNDFLMPYLILDNEDDFTLTLQIYTLKGSFGADYSLLMASLMLALIPSLIFFFLAQKGIISGITRGANK